MNQYARNSWCNLASPTSDSPNCEELTQRRQQWRERRDAYHLFERTAFWSAAEKQINNESCLADQYKFLADQHGSQQQPNRFNQFTAHNTMTWLYMKKIELIARECALMSDDPSRARRTPQSLRDLCNPRGLAQLRNARAQLRLSVTAADDRIFDVINENRRQIISDSTGRPITDREILALAFREIFQSRKAVVKLNSERRLYQKMKETLVSLSVEKKNIEQELKRELLEPEMSSDARQYLFNSGAVTRAIEENTNNSTRETITSNDSVSCLKSRYEPNIVGELAEFGVIAASGGIIFRGALRGLSATARFVGMSRTSSLLRAAGASRYLGGASLYGAYFLADGIKRECFSTLGTASAGRRMNLENLDRATEDLPEEIHFQEALLPFLNNVSENCRRAQGQYLVNDPRAGSCIQEAVMNVMPGTVMAPLMVSEVSQSFDRNN